MKIILIAAAILAALLIAAVASCVIFLRWIAAGEPDFRMDPERDGGLIK